MESRRLQQSLGREIEERALALIGVLEASSRNAIATQSVLEEVIAQRLLDNARFVDFLVGTSPQPQSLIARLASENKLATVELLDAHGQPAALPAPASMPPMMGGRGPGAGRRGMGGPPLGPTDDGSGLPAPPMTRGMMRPPHGSPDSIREESGRPAAPFMWGRRWGGLRGDPAQLFPSLPKDATIRRFWEGSAFGVAVPAQSFAGVIAVHADAEYLLNFRREIGLQRLILDLARQSGVTDVTLLDRDLTVIASSDAATIGRSETDPVLREALSANRAQGRRVARADGRDVYEVVKPFVLEAKSVGLIRLALGTEGLTEAARQAELGILWYSLGLVLIGCLGAAAIFWVQARALGERRALEGALVRQQRLSAMGNLAAGVAHEVRNPLNAISIGLQRLRLEFSPSDPAARGEYAQLARVIEAEVARLNAILERFLTLARPLALSLTVEPLSPVLAEVLGLLTPQAEKQGIRILQDLRLEGVRVSLDRNQLSHAVMNVLLNAIQAMPEGGSLTVTAERRTADGGGATACIAIADTGPGIPAAHLDRIFEPYFTTKAEGTGLGLALVHKIVEEHGGSIQATNRSQGGACFEIALPIAGGTA
jgi:signal transduction histidine kinase